MNDFPGTEHRPCGQKPKGRTVFEYYWEGGFPCRKEGYLLYFDGRVYTISEDISQDIAEHYDLVARLYDNQSGSRQGRSCFAR